MQKERDVSQNEGTKNNSYELLVSDHRKQQLKKRFDEQSYCTQNHWLRRLCHYFSITKHGTSIVMGFMGAWYFLSTIIHFAIAGVIAFIVLGLIEYAQRRSSDGFWDKYFQSHQTSINWGLLALSIICVGANGIITGYGYYQTTVRQSDAAPIIRTDSTLLSLNAQLLAIEGEIKSSRNTTWNGTTTVDAQRAIKQYSKTQDNLTSAIIKRTAKLEAKNEGIELTHQMSIEHIAWVAFIICLMVELLFECSMAYASYYDHRLYIEMGLDTRYLNVEDEIDTSHHPDMEEHNVQQQKAKSLNPEMPTYDLSETAIQNKRPMGFQHPKQSRNNETTVSETTKQLQQTTAKQRETAKLKQSETTVPQQSQSETTGWETVDRNKAKQHAKQLERVIETRIVSAPNKDISRLKRDANTYFGRSFKSTSSQETRNRNYQTFLEVKSLLETSGFQIDEGEEGKPKLTITEIKSA